MDEAGFHVAWGGDAAGGVGSLLPAGIATATAVGAVWPDPLFASEVPLVSAAVAERKLEFARGRSCARRALALLGCRLDAILATADRAPIWPDGFVGSISHCRDYCCAVVGRAQQWAGVGVDAEVLQPLEPAVQKTVLLQAEQRQIEHLDRGVPWPSVVFSIKEAIYKLWHPLMRCWLGFEDAHVHLDPARGAFEAELIGRPSARIPASLRRLEGRFTLEHSYVVSALTLSRADLELT